MILACAPVDLSGVASQEQLEPADVCTPKATDTSRPDEYAMASLPEVLWSYRSDVGSDFAPTIAGGLVDRRHRGSTRYMPWTRPPANCAGSDRLPVWRSAPPLVWDGVVYVSGEFRGRGHPQDGNSVCPRRFQWGRIVEVRYPRLDFLQNLEKVKRQGKLA